MPYICDVRVGCVAVYEEPKRDCLSLPMSSFAFYTYGKQAGSSWDVPAWRVREAQIVCSLLNSPHLLLRGIGRAYAAIHMVIASHK